MNIGASVFRPAVLSPGMSTPTGAGVPAGSALSSAAGTQAPENKATGQSPPDSRSAVSARSDPTLNSAEADEDQQVLHRLKARNREVHAHEAAHRSVGGSFAGSASFTQQRGPDGIAYAVGGEVPIDIAPVADDPQATINKMRTVRAAALAPAKPSAQDQQVAAQAAQTLLQAQSDLANRATDKNANGANEKSGTPTITLHENSEKAIGNPASQEARNTYSRVAGLASEVLPDRGGLLVRA